MRGRSGAERVVPLAAVVLTYNSKSTLTVVLDRVAAQTVRPARTIIVDNGSVDGSDELLLGAVGIETLLLGENRGVGAGHNAGWRAAMSDPEMRFIWALEHDSFPTPDCLERLLASFDEAGSTFPMGAAIPAQESVEGERQVGATEPIRTTMLHFNGALLSVRALHQVGLCSEDFFCGHEDRELGLRLAHGGWLTVWDPRAVVVHANYRDAQGRRRTVFRRYYGWRNDLWLRIHVRKEPWVRVRAIAGAGFFLTRGFVRERWPWPEAHARLRATIDALTGRLGRRNYGFLTESSVASQPVRGHKLRRPRHQHEGRRS